LTTEYTEDTERESFLTTEYTEDTERESFLTTEYTEYADRGWSLLTGCGLPFRRARVRPILRIPQDYTRWLNGKL
jgi:hypothetical protein